jgi:F-type H+-transporting ATPase subunit b
MNSRRPIVRAGWLWVVTGVLAILFLGCCALGQEPGTAPETRAEDPARHSADPQKAKEPARDAGFGAQLAKETREAAGEDEETAQFKQSPSVRWLAKLTGGNLQHAYLLAVLLNFAVIVGALFWAGKKFLPGAFRARTAAIQQAMEEARRSTEDANHRLSEIESRLSHLDGEIASMKAAGEADLAAEEARIKAAAEQDARKIIENAEQEIAAAVKSARRDLTTYAADLAVSLAKKQIHVDAGTDSTLVRSFADRLASTEERGRN